MKTRLMARVLAAGCAAALALAAAGAAGAQTAPAGTAQTGMTVSGVVKTTDGQPLVGATVRIGQAAATSDAAGAWSVAAPAGRQTLSVHRDGYLDVAREIDVSATLGPVEVTLPAALRLREDVVVHAVRARDTDPVAKTDVERDAIEQVNRGQEMPFLLGTTPSVTFQSDSGAAAGYAYFTIRGIGQTRLNVTLDGIPLQDPEDSALYFSNFGDFASVVDSVQLQRGVGTSTVGAASYGGSVNFASVNPATKTAVEFQAGGGSWGTARGTLGLHSGLVGGGLALYGRFSAQTSDGFREHSGANQKTVYYGATRQDDRSLLKVFGFSGRTRTQLAFLATEQSTLEQNLRFNALSPDERDDFGQDVVQVQYNRLVGSASTFTVQGYYNGARGWFRIWDATHGSLQQYGIDGYAAGAIVGATWQRGRAAVNWGAHVQAFTRDHFMDVVNGTRAYQNNGRKQEADSFLKFTWNQGPAQWWADAQGRFAKFTYTGDQPLGSVSWTFFNPKGGVRLQPTTAVGLYASVGRMSREPARSDMLNGEDNASLPYDLRAVQPEQVTDVEAGIDVHRGAWTLRGGLYAMEFRNEIALTGELSEIGLPIRRNVGQSYRRGAEVEAKWTPAPAFHAAGNLTVSRNRIASWTQYIDVYDVVADWVDSRAVTYQHVQPLLTPALIVNGSAGWTPHRDFGLDVSGRWAATAQLDNTGNQDFRTPSFFLLDAQASVGFSRWVRAGDLRLRIQGTNLLDNRRAWPGGYSYLYFVRGAGGTETFSGSSYYFPLATRSVYVTLDWRF